jgi:predicted small integral membrane protein
LVIFAALVAANLPFLSQRLALVGPVARPHKALFIRLLELVALYFIVGGCAMLLERRAGQNAPQGWEFYAITGTLFVTLAFPGFIYRYLVRRRG